MWPQCIHLQKEWIELTKRWKAGGDKAVKQSLKTLKHKDRLKVLEAESAAYFPKRHRFRRLILLQVCVCVCVCLSLSLLSARVPVCLCACCIVTLGCPVRRWSVSFPC